MASQVKWNGMEELRAALRQLPEDLTMEATRIVEGAANGAAAQIKAGYPVITGNLRDGVMVTHRDKGKFTAGAVVRNTAKHAWLYDNGSQERHWASGKSTGKMWGKSAPTHLFVKTVIRARKSMYAQLKDLLERKGLKVSGG
jgi:hypothetical protein